MGKEIILAAVGATGFGLLFGVQRKRLWIIFVSSGFAWYGYLILSKLTGKENLALFLITVFVMLGAKLAGLFVEESVVLFTTPILIPFIPGATLYYVMRDLVSQNSSFWDNLELLAGQVSAMVFGIVCVLGIHIRRR